MMSRIFKQAPCSAEQLKFRLLQSDEYTTAKKSMVNFWNCDSRAQYTQLEREGKAVFDIPVYDEDALNVFIPSSYGEHKIQLRVIRPREDSVRGVFLYIHGGGFVIGSASLHDNVLRDLAERTKLIIVAVEYRLAPEHKLPAGADDCVDAAMYLSSAEAHEKIGHTLRFIGGESAGAYLTVQTTLRLRDEKGIDVRKVLAGIVPTYGIHDLSLLPSVHTEMASTTEFPEERENFLWLALPPDVFGSLEHMKQPRWSPLYNEGFGNLPPAMFGVGAKDSLLDDSILMAARWELGGNKAELIIYPGSPHGYLVVDLDVTREAINDIVNFIKQRLG